MISDDDRSKERALLTAAQKENPELFVRQPFIDDTDVLKLIGIENVFASDRPLGYIRLYPSDFIVEEIAENGTIRSIAPSNDRSITGTGSTYYADLVKIGISTLDAKKEVAAHLGIEAKYIGSAGLKDESAITSQRISIRHLADSSLLSVPISERLFLKNISRGKGYLGIGRLQGNKFTIVIRLQETPSQTATEKIEAHLRSISESGFWNFFYTQRFGIPRLITHLQGLFVMAGEYEEAIKTCLTYLSPYELPYFHRIRKEIAASWKNWKAIEDIVRPFPTHFISERALVAHLVKHPDDFIGALTATRDETRIWAYSYASYLFNRKLSESIGTKNISPTFPLITSFEENDWSFYQDLIRADSIRLDNKVVTDLPFLKATVSTWPTTQKAIVHGFKIYKDTASISFSLPKGAYATSFLSNFFMLASDLPVLAGISSEFIDSQKMLNSGSLEPTLKIFDAAMKQRSEEIAKGFA